MASTTETNERAIAGVTHGLIRLGETVTWRARHFGVMLTQEALIDQYEQPHHFRDIMTKGMFRSFIHDHYFDELPNGDTMMRDELIFSAPLGPFGLLAERLMLKAYLARFLTQRNELIRKVAESPDPIWGSFIHENANTT